MLRLDIARLRGRCGDLVEEQVSARQMEVEQIHPQFGADGVELAPFRSIMGSYDYATAPPSLGTGCQPVPTSGDVPIPNSADLRFAIGMRALWYQASNQEFEGVEQALAGTLEMIGAYRAGR